MANGPDGCLWVIDMCRELIEGAAFLPPQILKHMDVASGVDRGRIWRIVPEGHQPPASPGWARRRRPSWSPCWSTRTAGTATRPRGCCTSGRIGRPSRPLRRLAAAFEAARRPRPCPGRARRAWRRSSRATSWPPSATPTRASAQHALRLAEPFCRADERISEPDDGDGRRPRPDGPLPVGVLARCAARRREPPRHWPRWPSATGPIPGCGWRSSAR